jgi:hypothetical protein
MQFCTVHLVCLSVCLSFLRTFAAPDGWWRRSRLVARVLSLLRRGFLDGVLASEGRVRSGLAAG